MAYKAPQIENKSIISRIDWPKNKWLIIGFFVLIFVLFLANKFIFNKSIDYKKLNLSERSVVDNKFFKARVAKIYSNYLSVRPYFVDWQDGKFKKIKIDNKTEIIIITTVSDEEILGASYQEYLKEQEKARSSDKKIAEKAREKIDIIYSKAQKGRSDAADEIRRQIDSAIKRGNTANIAELEAKEKDVNSYVRFKKGSITDFKENDDIFIYLNKGLDGLKDSMVAKKIEIMR